MGRLTGAALLGFVTLVIAFVIFTFALPYLIPLAFGTFILVLIFLAIWGITYVAIFLGVALFYLFKPMKVEKREKGYSIEKSKEAGRRQKGEN